MKQKGLSLIELLISITLGLILMTGVVQMFLSSKVAFTSQQGISRIQETGRLAIEFMTRDIRQAGTFGCSRGNSSDSIMQLQNANLNLGGLHTSFNEGLRGYDSATDLPLGIVPSLGLATTYLNESILVVRSAQDLGLGITQPTSVNDVVAAVPNGAVIANNCIAGLCVGDAAVVTDCYNGTVIQIAGLTMGGGALTVNHANAWDNKPAFNYRSGSIASLSTIEYFIADSAAIPGRPSLYKRTNIIPPEEILEGVEHMSVTYAIGFGLYQSAAAITAANSWANVTSVRIEVVVRSLENYVVDAAVPYTFKGAQVIPGVMPNGVPDRFLRQVFSTTIDIRSR